MTAWISLFDGACPRGIPTFGIVLRADGQLIVGRADRVDLLSAAKTTNVGEWGGAVAALEEVEKRLAPGDSLEVRGDSQLVLRQLAGVYRLRKPHLAPYLARARAAAGRMSAKGVKVALVWVSREENQEADALSHSVPIAVSEERLEVPAE